MTLIFKNQIDAIDCCKVRLREQCKVMFKLPDHVVHGLWLCKDWWNKTKQVNSSLMRYLEKNSWWLSVLLIPSAQSRKDLFSFFLTFLCDLWLPRINPVQEFMVLHQLSTPWLPWNTVTSPTHRHLQASASIWLRRNRHTGVDGGG